MSDLGLYDGCFAVLRNGKEVGPLELKRVPHSTVLGWTDGGMWWTRSGAASLGGQGQQDIVRVLRPKGRPIAASDEARWDRCRAPRPVPEHVLQAAREAGLKAVPTYDLFVEAVVEAAFAAAGTTAPITTPMIDGSRFQGELTVKLATTTRIDSEDAKIAARIALDLLMDMAGRGPAENESVPGSNAVQEIEGGQSDRVKRQRQVYPFSPVDPKGSATSSKGCDHA